MFGGGAAAVTPRPTEFYHGTSLDSILKIQDSGFNVDLAGSNAGAALGPGVYLTTNLQKALNYAKRENVPRKAPNPAAGGVFKLEVDLGRCYEVPSDPTRAERTGWAADGYDSAWAAAGIIGEMEENCVRDPARIRITDVILGNTSAAGRLGYEVRNGRLEVSIAFQLEQLHRSVEEAQAEAQRERDARQVAERQLEQQHRSLEEAQAEAQRERDARQVAAAERQLEQQHRSLEALETVVFVGDANRYHTSIMEDALSNVAQLVPGLDWRPLLTKELVEEHLTKLVRQKGFYTGDERRGATLRGLRIWNLTDAPLTCVATESDTGETAGDPFTIKPFDPSALRISADTCPWVRGFYANTSTKYLLSIDGLEPTNFCVNGDSSQHCVVRISGGSVGELNAIIAALIKEGGEAKEQMEKISEQREQERELAVRAIGELKKMHQKLSETSKELKSTKKKGEKLEEALKKVHAKATELSKEVADKETAKQAAESELSAIKMKLDAMGAGAAASEGEGGEGGGLESMLRIDAQEHPEEGMPPMDAEP